MDCYLYMGMQGRRQQRERLHGAWNSPLRGEELSPAPLSQSYACLRRLPRPSLHPFSPSLMIARPGLGSTEEEVAADPGPREFHRLEVDGTGRCFNRARPSAALWCFRSFSKVFARTACLGVTPIQILEVLAGQLQIRKCTGQIWIRQGLVLYSIVLSSQYSTHYISFAW